MRTLTWVAILLFAEQALAENAHLTAARQAFEDVDFEQVIPLLDQALASGPDDAEKVEIFVLMGQVHMAYGRVDEAERTFVEALKLDRDYVLPETVAPKISATFETARTQVVIERVEDGPLSNPEPAALEEDESVLSQWWLWAIVGTVVAGTSGILAWQLSQPTEPEYDHGVFRF